MNLGVVSMLFAAGFAFAATSVTTSEVVTLPTYSVYGGGDTVGSQFIGRTYNAGNGPGIWVVADGGYRLYVNGELLAEDNQAGRVTFVPMTFLPGENAVSVVGLDGNGAPGVLVQIDELDTNYYSGSGWYAKPSVSNTAWKSKGRDLSAWGHATTYGGASTMPSGAALSGFASGSGAQWIWTSAKTDTLAVLLFTFYIKAEGFGAATTGGEGGKVVIASDSASIRKAMQSTDAEIILVPEGTYDFRQFRNAVTEATAAGRTWCTSACGSSDSLRGKNPYYRIAFAANSCASLGTGLTIVKESDGLKSWSNWMTTKPDKTLIGMGRGANLRGASFVMRSYEGAKNQIYRNLAIYDVNPHLVEAGDGLEAVGSSSNHSSNLWADHISYKWISDGMDMEYTDGVTVSWLDYDGANEFNCQATDPYMALIEDTKITYANTYWHNTYGRVPKAAAQSAATLVHLYNTYVDYNRFFTVGAGGNSSTAYAQVLYENNYVNREAGYYTDKGDYGYINWKNNTVANSLGNGSQFCIEGTSSRTCTATAPTDNVFSPTYSYVFRDRASLPTTIPEYAGIGGKWGSMPTYDQAFGISNKAPSVSLSAAVGSDKSSITFTVTASDSDGTIANVAFYVGNTLVGTATSSPYKLTVSGVPAGTYSLIAKATDNSGLTNASAFVTLSVAGPTTGITSSVSATEAEAGYYRIYNVQGRPVYAGEKLPAKYPAGQSMVVEYGSDGKILKTWMNVQK